MSLGALTSEVLSTSYATLSPDAASKPDTLVANAAPVALPEPANPYSGAWSVGPSAVTGGNADEIAVAYSTSDSTNYHIVVQGYGVDGSVLFSDPFDGTTDQFIKQTSLAVAPDLATVTGAGVVLAFSQTHLVLGVFATDIETFDLISATGASSSLQFIDSGRIDDSVAFTALPGFHLEWTGVPGAPGSLQYYSNQDFTSAGAAIDPISRTPGGAVVPYADTSVGGRDFEVIDNQAQIAGSVAVTLPGEPAHAITEEVAAGLAGGTTAAVAFADSGTSYVSIFDSTSNSFTPRVTLDWGGASDPHLVALPDGGFVVSWQNGRTYAGEVFTADGTGGGVIPLDGQVAAIDSHGDLYTVGLNASGQYEVQTYVLNGVAPGNPSIVSTSDVDYTAPDGVKSITLTGAFQAIHANDAGDVIWSDNSVNALYGGIGNDTFHMGRGGDWAAGGAGADTFIYPGIPWASGGITDFNAAEGDKIDLTGLLANAGFTGSDPFADGYLKLTTDGTGNAVLWANYNQLSNDGWWPVATLDGVAASSLHFATSPGQILDVPGARDSIATGINNQGDVVLNYAGSVYPTATLYESGQFTSIYYPGSEFTSAEDINDRGQVTGAFLHSAFGETLGYVYYKGAFQAFNVPGATGTDPSKINDQGDVVGTYYANSTAHGFLHHDGAFQSIDVPGATSTEALGLNGNGDIVGAYRADGVEHGFIYSNGSFTTLDVPGSADTRLNGIDNAGDIVGYFDRGGQVFAGFLYKDGVFTQFDVGVMLSDINDRGQMVGNFSGTASHIDGLIASTTVSLTEWLL
jgi:hypothetical protein